jgi:hemerythrin
MINKVNTAPQSSTKNHVEWSDSYSIGISKIDDQHKELLEHVNDMFSHVTGNEAQEHAYFSEIIHKLVEYVKFHFANEEKVMLATKFPGYEAHKKAHEEFILTIIQTTKKFEAGKRLMLEKLAYFLKDWVLSHIAVMDKQYAQYFRKIATRKADGKLSITAADIA